MYRHLIPTHLKPTPRKTFLPHYWNVKKVSAIHLLVAGLFRVLALHRNYFVWSGYKGASIWHAFCACRYFCVFVIAKALTEHKLFYERLELKNDFKRLVRHWKIMLYS